MGRKVRQPDRKKGRARSDIGAVVRLVYKGKPVSDCKVEDRIEAADHLDAFISARSAELARINERAREASFKLSKLLGPDEDKKYAEK